MKVHYISDLHLDFWVKEIDPNKDKTLRLIHEYADMAGLNGSADVLLIAGDLGHYFNQNKTLLTLLKSRYDEVLVVPGNHDMYLVSNSIKEKYKYFSFNRILEIKEFCDSIGVHYLTGETIDIAGVKFFGTSMSWDTSHFKTVTGLNDKGLVTELYKRVMNDSRLIMNGFEPYVVPGMYGGAEVVTSFDPYQYFMEEYQKLKAVQEADVVCTHYGPIIPPMMPPLYKKDEATTFYYFNGKRDVNRIAPKVWLFGHTHTGYEWQHHGTTMLCNPLGYPHENTYAVAKTFEI